MSRAGSIYKDKDSGLWAFRVDVAPRGVKRRQVHKRGYKTKREAHAALVEILGNVRAGTHVNPNAMTLRQWLDAWCDGLPATGLRPRTVESYTDMLTGLVVPRLGDARLQALLPADLNRLYAALLGEGRRPGRGLSTRTVRYVHTILGKALCDAVKQGLLTRNPADLASPPSHASTRAPEMATWTPEQLREFLELLRATGTPSCSGSPR